MTSLGSLARALVSRRWLWVSIVVLILMGVLARLGFWQLDRLEQRRAANALLIAALESEPIDLNADIKDFTDITPTETPESLANRDIIMTGVFDYDNQRILKLQNWDGRAGVHLITPMVLDGADVAVLVDRGWIPDSEYDAGNLFDAVSGNQTVEGYIALTETISRLSNSEAGTTNNPGKELFRVDIAAVEEELPYAIAPFYVKQSLAGETAQPGGLPIPVPKEIDLSEGPHLDYALQWFIFSLGLGIAYVIFVRRSLTREEQQSNHAERD